MNDTITPLTVEHEGSRIEVSQEGITVIGPCIRINSGPANAGDKAFQVGDMQVAIGAGGVSLNSREIVLPATGNVRGKHV